MDHISQRSESSGATKWITFPNEVRVAEPRSGSITERVQETQVSFITERVQETQVSFITERVPETKDNFH